MPNWVECDLRIEGKKRDLEKFKKFAKEGENLLSANKFIPYPQVFKDMDKVAKDDKVAKNGFNSGGYEWCIENWGTKWGLCDVKDESDCSDELFYGFGTAWSPPNPVIIKMGEMFPKLTFDLRYFEGAMGFNGILRVEGGKVVKDESASYYGDRGG